MPDTLDAFDIPTTWTDVNTLTGIPAGTEIKLQNVGLFGDVIEVATSALMPSSDFCGISMKQYLFYLVDAGEAAVWARFVRKAGQTPAKGVTKLQVQT